MALSGVARGGAWGLEPPLCHTNLPKSQDAINIIRLCLGVAMR